MLLYVWDVSKVVLFIIIAYGVSALALTAIAVLLPLEFDVLSFFLLKHPSLDLLLFLELIEIVPELLELRVLQPVLYVKGQRQIGKGILIQERVVLSHVEEEGLFVAQVKVIL